MNDYNVYEDHDHWGWLAQPVLSFGLLCFTILMLLCGVSSATAATTDTSAQLMFSYQADLSDAQVLQGATVQPQPVYLFMQNASGYRGVRYLCCDAARSGTEHYVSNAPLFTQSYDFTGQTPGDKGVYLDEYTSAGYQKRAVTFTLGSAASSDYPPGYVFLEGKGNLNVSGSGTGNEYWVDINNPLADDDSAGTKDAPWKTFSHAVKTATAGDTVYVMPGVYEDPEAIIKDEMPHFSPVHSGEPGNPVTYKSVVKGGAILKSESQDNSAASNHKALSVYDKTDLIFDGFKTIGMVHFKNSERINFINGEVTVGSLLWNDPSLLSGITLERADNCVIRNNYIHAIAPAYQGGEVYSSHNQAAIMVLGTHGETETDYVSNDNLIEYNLVDASDHAYAGLGTKAGSIKGNVWRNNFVKNAVSGIYSTGSTDTKDNSTSSDQSVYTNNIVVNGKNGIEFNYLVIDAVVNNNIIANVEYGFWFTALNSTNMILKNNLFSDVTKSVYRAVANWGVIEGERDRFYQMFSAMDGNHYDQYQRFSFQERAQGHLIHSSLADFQAEAPTLEVNAVETPVDFINPDGDAAEDFRPYVTMGEISAGAYTTAETIVGTY
ncbi:hypothetical protein VA7868_01070 [Vibrio aerogenes CECT 7868]|uniref:Uncharacterized protein n=1 Tax=Vibrio aerogenes CECT 7868 TaxID=1216006 RepID=A0A1M5XAX1_9VIBR|nr:NosD domain-containing protein [Vibrio aerogenes]SHH96889.1 hypothetical protein VA7868_01070 [Vibrio aerogenes CECT 7868]